MICLELLKMHNKHDFFVFLFLVKEKLKEKERVMVKGQKKITAWMSKTSKRRPPRTEKTGVR